ncbi:ATP synthase subunit D [Endozoicomonas montiporae]|uniref:ATP synthase subunit D n=2 Tax=Endozoicomonas montiporae TaxID=1027273 RepID=A0A081N541_9GAMM|nr:V-type ATP synthase subunit D [Endozoicomonas montiporae]AMO57559.1 V-type ATP synthase subunit D [Endozoicomonas montiporae CL-33]KEQ13564.1 ATP synthase subunit D [Endozoicomonas montiporae]
MAKVALNKSSLNKEKRSLKTYNRYLPALELKRQQLMAERKKAEEALAEARTELADVERLVQAQLPMLARADVPVENLVRVKNVKLIDENIVGTTVPAVGNIDIELTPYSDLAKPHWVDFLVELLQKMVRLRVEYQVRELRHAELDKATRTTSQRVNLFSKVLIPQTKKNIQKIQIYMSDQDRASVMNAKLSKGKVLAQEAKAAAAG